MLKKFRIYLLKEFIKYCDIIDNTDGLKEFLKIKTSIIFFASFIGAHFNKLTFPKLDNFVFPTNIDNIICNLLNINNDKLNHRYTELITEEIKRNKIIYTNYDIYDVNILPKIFKDGGATFENNKFSDCVENTLLHFVRAIIWDPKSINYNYDFLPDTSIPELKDFVKLLKIGNENTQEIKNEFNKIIQNKDQFKNLYKKTIGGIKYEIKSNIANFKTFLNYLFGITVGDCIEYKYPNINIKEIKEDNSTIYIEYNNISYILGFNIYNGHSMVTKNITNPSDRYQYMLC